MGVLTGVCMGVPLGVLTGVHRCHVDVMFPACISRSESKNTVNSTAAEVKHANSYVIINFQG